MSMTQPAAPVDSATAQKPERYLSANDLIDRGVVKNTMTLWRWRQYHGFPEPIALGPNTVRYRESEVDAWIDQRARASRVMRPRGRHLKKSQSDPSGAAA